MGFAYIAPQRACNHKIKLVSFVSKDKKIHNVVNYLILQGIGTSALLVLVAFVSCINGSPLPQPIQLEGIKALKGMEQKYKEAKDVVPDQGPGLFSKGILGIKPQMIQTIPFAKEFIKEDGVLNKALGTGPVLMEREKPLPKTVDSDDDTVDQKADDKDEGGLLTRGIHKLADAGHSDGKSVKLIPIPTK